jgi:choline dehydrogenase-like flavoprotein
VTSQDWNECEVAVIGSGPGGAITASTLAAHGRDVILLEEGPNLPLDSCVPFSPEEMQQKYRCGGLTTALGSPKVVYVEGRCVGGGSEINSGLYHRTPPAMLDRWRTEFEVEALSMRDLEPHFQANEEAVTVCLTPGPTPLASRKLQAGAESLGWRAPEIPRCFHYDGNIGCEGVPQGKRQSMSRTFIPAALDAGCRLVPETRAVRLRRNNGGWNIEANTKGRPVTIAATDVFVAAGAVQTPALLRRSGITSHIGDTFSVHPTVKVIARFDERLNYPGLGVSGHQVKEFSPRISFGCSISSPGYLGLAMLDHPAHRRETLLHGRQMAMYYAMIAGDTQGRVRVLPGVDDPIVTYQVSRQDLRDLATGLRLLCELLFASGARELYPSVSGVPRLLSADDLSLIPPTLPPNRTSLMTIHLFSSCPMGENRKRCAANSFGKVHGQQGLYISDASLICTAPGVNPQGTVMALARRNALAYVRKL